METRGDGEIRSLLGCLHPPALSNDQQYSGTLLSEGFISLQGNELWTTR